MISAVAPAAPAIPFALLALSSAIAFVVSWGLLHGWNRTLGYVLTWLANVKIPLPKLPDVHPFGFANTVNNTIVKYLGQAVAATEHAMTTSFHKCIGIILWSAQETAGLATDVYNAIRGVEHTAVKTLTKVVTHTVVKPITTTVKVAGAITAAKWNALTHRVDALAARVTHLAHAGAGAIALPFPRLGRLEKKVTSQAKRLTRVEKILAGGLGVAVVLRALSKLGLGWLRCNNVGKAGKAVCKMDASLLESLLLDAAALSVAFNLEQFARELQTVTGEAARLIHNFAD